MGTRESGSLGSSEAWNKAVAKFFQSVVGKQQKQMMWDEGFFFEQFITCQSSAVTISEETENLLALLAFSMA
jgi:hypothetical protein